MGGRFNPIGVDALYLALSAEGALLEMANGFIRRFNPLTLCSYSVDLTDIFDLRTETVRLAMGVRLEDMAAPWDYIRLGGSAPPPWGVARRLVEAGASGILTPSFAKGARPDMANLVLWKWGPDLPHKVEVIDPEGRLPKDQSSWP